MSLTNTSIATKVALGVVGLALVFGFAFATPAKAQTVEDLQAQIAALLETIAALQQQLNTLQGGGAAADCGFTRDLTVGVRGDDVTCLQNYLTGTGHFTYSGGSTGYFGPITQSAVAAWQAANNVSPPAGYFGPISKAKYSSLLAAAPAPAPTPAPDDGDTTPAPAPAGTGLSVSSTAQPAATLAPFNAARVPFTNFVVTAGNDGDVVMNSVVVERTGLAQDKNFASVMLLDENAQQVGNTKTLNSNHRATVGEAVTIPSGTSKKFTIAANMSTSANVQSGEVASFTVVSINTSATVSGSLPITGASHTMNNTLTIGTVTVQRGTLDPNTEVTKEVGTEEYTFSALRVTAGSNEKVIVESVRWNQSSSSASSDLANVMVVVDGEEYPTTVSSNGKYYTAVFPGGITIDKGAQKEISIKADIASGSGRTITFDIEKTTDIYLKGELYGYGVTPPTSGTGISTGNIWFAGSTVTVGAGSLTFSQDTAVASQNIAVNVSDQTFAGFKVDVDGEPVTVDQIVFDIATSTGAGVSSLLTDVSIVDSNGVVVAGPVDAKVNTATQDQVTFSDAITFPVGLTMYTVKGKVPSSVPNDTTYQLTTNPASDWTTVTGDTTGDTITPSPSGDQALQTMTVKAGALVLSVSNTPSAQTVVAGVQGFTFANYQLDASASGEDVKFNNLPLEYNASGTATNLTKCQLWDGSKALNTGTNIIDPSAAASSTTFTFDTALIVPKGTIKTLALSCNISSNTANDQAYQWGYDSDSTPSATGVTSGATITVTENDSAGQLMTIQSSGTFTVALDSSSPSYNVVAANTTGNSVSALRFEATNEAIDLKRLAIQLTNTASSSASDVVRVTVWDSEKPNEPIGEAIFTGTNTLATSTFTESVRIPKDGHKVLTLKADFTEIGTGKPATQGHLVAIDYDGGDVSSTDGTGVASGADIDTSSTGDTASEGARLFKSYPTVTKLAVTTNTLANGVKSVLRWRVDAASYGDIGIGKFVLTFATTTATFDEVNIYCYTDSGFSSVCSGLSTDGGLQVTDYDLQKNWVDTTTEFNFAPATSADASTTIQVPAGGSRWFEARGTVSGSASGASLTTTLEGDAAYMVDDDDFMMNFTDADGDANDDLLWSPNATTTSGVDHEDWANGYGVSGFPSTGISDTLSQ